MSGKFLHLNQGEFYVYSPDGGIEGIDTVKIEGGDFVYEIPCDDDATLMLVFPNFSEQAVFAQSGKAVSIKADASHLKEMEVSGNKENELMTRFRKQIANASPPEIQKYAIQLIEDYPQSRVGSFLVRKYFIQVPKPDYKQALRLIDLMLKEQPKNGYLVRMKQQVEALKNTTIGGKLPTFTAYDTNGKLISSATLSASPVSVITTWTSWNYESQQIQRQLKQKQQASKGKLKLVGFCVDAGKRDCQNTMKRDSITWQNACNEEMFDGKAVRLLGLSSVPDNILVQKGRIIARGMDKEALMKKLDELLP